MEIYYATADNGFIFRKTYKINPNKVVKTQKKEQTKQKVSNLDETKGWSRHWDREWKQEDGCIERNHQNPINNNEKVGMIKRNACI